MIGDGQIMGTNKGQRRDGSAGVFDHPGGSRVAAVAIRVRTNQNSRTYIVYNPTLAEKMLMDL